MSVSVEELIRREDDIRANIVLLIQSHHGDFAHYWRFGDGRGGSLLDLIGETLRGLGYQQCHTDISHAEAFPRQIKKVKLPARLRKQVFERDEYRCQRCHTHLDLTIDHIIPESLDGPSELDNLQVLCRICNSKKGARLEVNQP